MRQSVSGFSSITLLGVAAAALVASGCSDSPFETAPVTGTVTVDGQPLPGGRVMFTPVAKPGNLETGKPAFGQIQSDGRYELSTYSDRDGAVVGDHLVAVYGPEDDAPAGASVPKFSRVSVPGTKTVAAGQDNQIDIAITRQDLARYLPRSK